MLRALPLLAALACAPPAGDKGGPAGRETGDTGACAPTDEIAYDGIDQDCDGADLTDVDEDGHDAERAGGDDCDDADALIAPGAPDRPYDGIDQDCDGADLTDVDGDGHDAERAGGDDCDDEASGVSPGAEEIQGDGVDQDCDGLTDEWDLCADGTGDFAGIQEAIDGSGERAPVFVLCPGSWSESVSFETLNLTIVGGGAEPDEVVWRPRDSAVLIDVGDDPRTELHLRNLSLLADKDLNQSAVSGAGASFSFERVAIDGFGNWANWALLLWATDGPIDVLLSEVYLGGAAYGGLLLYADGVDVGLDVSASVFDDNGEFDLFVWGLSESVGGGGTAITELTLGVRNSLFAAPAWRSVVATDVADGEIVIENNTFVGLVSGAVSDVSYLIGVGYANTETRIASNAFVDSEAQHLWTGWWCPTGDWDCLHAVQGGQSDAWPDTFAYNLGWDAWTEELGWALRNGDAGDAAYTLLEDMEAGITEVDPGLSASSTPPYANPAGGAGVDAGDPDPAQDDPDGSPNDVGAYGGPDGGW